MRILLASSEAVPFSKTGGLADATSALSKALSQLGHEVWLVIPHYPQVQSARNVNGLPIDATGPVLDIPIGTRQVSGNLLHRRLPGTDVRVLMVDQPHYFDRPALYGEGGTDYEDNCERFVFFSRAVLEAARHLDLRPDVIHANDWQSALIPALLQIEYRHVMGFHHTGSVLTLHNLAFQGVFGPWGMQLAGLDWKYFNWQQMEYYGNLNLLKAGIVFADMINTVSPTYAGEIQTDEFGCGLQGVLRGRADDLVGILNGVDTDEWDPSTDSAIAANYSIDNFDEGKAACKADLQQSLGLPVRSDVPVLGMISRMTEQKGFDLIEQCITALLSNDLQLVFLGSGTPRYEQLLTTLQSAFPDKISVTIGFDEALARRIEAGSDAYLMPSRYEPCGLNQMYSMRYGTLPIVHRVGGLADSVVDCNPHTLQEGTATGFVFDRYEGEALSDTVHRAMTVWSNQPQWKQLAHNGMRKDCSWQRSALDYVEMYRWANGSHEIE